MEETVGGKIRLLRERAGLTQEEVAEAMHVSRQAVSKWESGLSRPSSDNLIRLARLFKVELTAIIGEPETEETEEAVMEEETAAEKAPQAPKKRRIWPWVMLAAVLFILILPAITSVFCMVNTEIDGPGEPSISAEAEVVETELPYTLPLTGADYLFEPYTNYNTAAEGETVEEGLLFQYRWPHTDTTLVFYQERSDYKGESGAEDLYHLYAAYTTGGDYTVMARMAEDRADAGAPTLAAFDALGYSGCKVVTTDDMGTDTFFFGLDESGTPRLLYMTPGETAEWDIDGDGENELTFFRHPEGILFLDREVEDYTAYTLAEALPEGTELTAEVGAFHLHAPGEEGRSFVYFWGGELVPVRYAADTDTPFAQIELAPTVEDTVITFLDGSLPPDAPYGGEESGLPTHRQLAYMGLQTLYDLTGQSVARCYAYATEYGVTFSMDKNWDRHSFFSFERMDEWYDWGGGRSVPDQRMIGGAYIAWHSADTPWSPIQSVETGDAQWVYEHVTLLQSGPIVSESFGLGTDVRLHLSDGSFYEVSFDDDMGRPTRIQGVYPKGFEH